MKFFFLLLTTRLCIVSAEEISVVFHENFVILRTDSLASIAATFKGPPKSEFVMKIEVTCEKADVCSFENSTQEIDFSKSEDGEVSLNLTLKALFLGHTIPVLKTSRENTTFRVENEFKITILRNMRGKTLSDIFTYVLALLIIINTFMMGTQLDIKIIKKVVRRPIGPAIGFCCQYIVMPLTAFGYASWLLSGYQGLQFGYFAVGCSPGGGLSNFWTILLEGNLDLSVTMTFFSNTAALGMLPLWIYTLGKQFFTGDASIPFFDVVRSLLTLIVPASLGMILIHFKPQLAAKFEKVLRLATFIILLIGVPFLIYANLFVFSLMRWYVIICSFLLPWTGYLISYVAAYCLKQEHRDCRTIAIETGIQNTLIAMLICRFSLPEPDSDLTVVMPVCVFLFTSLPLWFGLVILKWHNRREQKKIVEMTDLHQDVLDDRDEVTSPLHDDATI